MQRLRAILASRHSIRGPHGLILGVVGCGGLACWLFSTAGAASAAPPARTPRPAASRPPRPQAVAPDWRGRLLIDSGTYAEAPRAAIDPRFVVAAPAGIDPRFVVAAPAGIDDRMIVAGVASPPAPTNWAAPMPDVYYFVPPR